MNGNVNGCLEAQMDGELYQEEPGTVFSLSCSRWHNNHPYRAHQGRMLAESSLSDAWVLFVPLHSPCGHNGT